MGLCKFDLEGNGFLCSVQDGSTMLIEAAKGGHAAVVNLLLDFAGHQSQSLTDELNQSQFSLDYQQASLVNYLVH